MNASNRMSIWKNVWGPGVELRRELDQLFEDWGASIRSVSADGQSFTPLCEVEEAEDHYLLSLEIPGVKKEDLQVETADGELVVSGIRRPVRENRWYSERRFGEFRRSFALPRGVDTAKIEAHSDDGVLRIVLPKTDSARPRQIKISTGTGSSGFLSRILGTSNKEREALKDPQVAAS